MGSRRGYNWSPEAGGQPRTTHKLGWLLSGQWSLSALGPQADIDEASPEAQARVFPWDED